ncbi:MAG TPA: indole-3-glycerol phosphate synthase TrpC, partial [Fimbriimonadaceae bacterium]|nr:indole-3-glycerol phosphate synthase TrpC [Fimbriimonadaceae bacterium]
MDVLTRIFEAKREALARRKAEAPLDEVKRRAVNAPAVRPFHAALEDSSHRPSLIAEVKKASPVKGVVREDFNAVEIARAYREAGADCLSVLTDVEFFQGHPDYLAQCREESGLPVLRKDFTVDEYDVWQSRVLGADAVLLIVAGLDTSQLRDYREVAEGLGMDALVEAHSLEEAEAALETGATLVGVNNRDLTTFETDLAATEKTVPKIA